MPSTRYDVIAGPNAGLSLPIVSPPIVRTADVLTKEEDKRIPHGDHGRNDDQDPDERISCHVYTLAPPGCTAHYQR